MTHTTDQRTPQLYIKRCSYDQNSWSVFERGRKNQFGEPYCHEVACTRAEAERFVKNFQAAEVSHV